MSHASDWRKGTVNKANDSLAGAKLAENNARKKVNTSG